VDLDMNEMEKLDAFDVDTTDTEKAINERFEKHKTKGDCLKSNIMIQNNIANIQKGVEDDICDDGYDVGF